MDFSVAVLTRNKSNDLHYAGTYTFDAGEEVFPRRYEIVIRKEWTRPGENSIVLKNDSLVNAERRLHWDYLALYRVPSAFSYASR